MGRQLRRHGSLTIYSSRMLHSEPVSATVREFFTQPLLGLYHRASTEGVQESLPCPFTLSNLSDSSIDYNINLNKASRGRT